MSLYLEEELEYDKKFKVKPVVKECIDELLNRFWVLRDVDETLFYKIKDNEVEIKKYFRENFLFRLITNNDVIKLEKVPVVARSWMGEKVVNGTSVFKRQMDFCFFFYLLAYLESKNIDQQFTLQYIVEYLQVQEDGALEWKGGSGYTNRLSLVRVLKYAVKMKLIIVDDQEIDDYSGNDDHDVLLRRTPYCSFFMRYFREDVTSWNSLKDFMNYLEQENFEMVDRKHRYYRRLFLEPIVYHNELGFDELEYVKNYYPAIENHFYRYSDLSYERYKTVSMLTNDVSAGGQNLFPSENMTCKLILQFASYLYDSRFAYPLNKSNQIELSFTEITNLVSDIKQRNRLNWTKVAKKQSVDDLREEIIAEMKKWALFDVVEDEVYVIKEGLFRIIGDY
ncbi:TIGR02678 family protein [Robertmurraya kyonggiensis]|nr:TIGR02678 family protein [Robertmurraya kyonggiensis]